MRSFRVETATDFQTPGFFWSDNHVLSCRPCEQANGEDSSSFVPGTEIKVGMKLRCPFCGEQSIVPKKARWVT